MKKKITVWILCVAMVTALLPVHALAEFDTPTPLYTLPDGASGKVVINLGNGNGKYNFADYTGSKAAGTALRYTTQSLEDYADDYGDVLINLPSDDDLGADFVVVDAIGDSADADYKPAVTITLEREKAYDYKLVGWVNIVTGDYIDVSSGSAYTVINLEYENVFYADWIAADYNLGSGSDSNLRDDMVSTSDFVTMHMFDYNELFNLYSESLVQNTDGSESWTDGQKLYSALPYGNGDELTSSFIFVNDGTTSTSSAAGGMLSWPNNKTLGNTWTGTGEFPHNAFDQWGIEETDSPPLNMLFDTSGSYTGVHYVGEGDYLFWIDDDGYYTYDSSQSAASYNQEEKRFYVYDSVLMNKGRDETLFLPYTKFVPGTSKSDSPYMVSDGSVNYWFGMDMSVDFYLPSATGKGGNTVNGNNMVFNFSGDDDILIFVDNELMLDMSGIHDEAYGSIDFTDGTISMWMLDYDDHDEDGHGDYNGKISRDDEYFSLSAGSHKLQIYYMERGGFASNLKIQFNIVPLWKYETGPVSTVTAKKSWVYEDGTPITDPSDMLDSVEVGLFDVLSEKSDDNPLGYTKSGNTYTFEYTDDMDDHHEFVYTVSDSGDFLIYKKNDEDAVIYDGADRDGKVTDTQGLVVAWLEDGKLHIRIDEQTLSSDNDWYYAWEILDPEGTYEVIELSKDSLYVTTSVNDELTSYQYWSIIGESYIEEHLADSDFTVILTEAAQEAEAVIGDTKEALGWVILGTDTGITTKQVKFSQIATLSEILEDNGTTSFFGAYGVTSKSEIDSLGPGAIWHVEDTNKQTSDVDGGTIEEFYLYCELNGTRYYLSLDDDGSGYEFLNVSTTDMASFYYDALGELMIELADGETVRVEILEDGTIDIDQAETQAATDDIRIYTLTDTATSGFAAEIINTKVTVDISGFKTWDDAENQDGNRPSYITIELLADGESVQTITVTASDNWAWDFADLPKYNDEGHEIQYRIIEDVNDDYSTSYSGDEIINSYEPGKTSVTVTKFWDDDEDIDDLRTFDITVELLADGVETGMTLTLNDENNWIGSFTDLDMYHEGSQLKYTFTIKEYDIDGYDAVISGDMEHGYMITNIHIPYDETDDTGGSARKTGTGGPENTKDPTDASINTALTYKEDVYISAGGHIKTNDPGRVPFYAFLLGASAAVMIAAAFGMSFGRRKK